MNFYDSVKWVEDNFEQLEEELKYQAIKNWLGFVLLPYTVGCLGGYTIQRKLGMFGTKSRFLNTSLAILFSFSCGSTVNFALCAYVDPKFLEIKQNHLRGSN